MKNNGKLIMIKLKIKNVGQKGKDGEGLARQYFNSIFSFGYHFMNQFYNIEITCISNFKMTSAIPTY